MEHGHAEEKSCAI